jgi:hypothetical protein
MRIHNIGFIFCLLSFLPLTLSGQGIRYSKPYNVYELLESPINGNEIFKKAAIYDSTKRGEALVFAPLDTVDGWRSWATVENFTFGKNRGDMPMIADANALHPYFRDKVLQLIAACKKKGIEVAIVETYRTRAKQAEYKGMGKKYTSSGAGKSKHQYGLAIDIVPIVGDTAVWHNKVLWKKIGVIGERIGLRWGGRWRHPFDPGHFEWSGGLTGLELSAGTEPFIPLKNKQYPCLEEDLRILRKYWNEWEGKQGAYFVRN